MATYQFKNSTNSGIGTSATAVYTAPVGKKSIAIGCVVTNTTGAALPVTLTLVKADQSVLQLAKNARIDGGQSVDFLSGKKLVIQATESLQLNSPIASSLDCLVSVLEDVD